MVGMPPGKGTPGTSSGTTTFVQTEDTSITTVVPNVIARSEHIAQYFADDLEEFVRLTHVDLADELQIPLEYLQDPRDIIAMLYDDLSHMLRDELITGIHLLLSENTLNPDTGAYLVRYHVQYVIHAPTNLAAPTSPSQQPKPFGGLIVPPLDVLRHTRFTLLVDWNSQVKSRRQQVRRPAYNFDWVPETNRLDATTVMRYHEGGLTVDGAQVVERRQSS